MNCPSRVDADLDDPGHNQNPPAFAADLTTNADLNHIVNSRARRGHRLSDDDDPARGDASPDDAPHADPPNDSIQLCAESAPAVVDEKSAKSSEVSITARETSAELASKEIGQSAVDDADGPGADGRSSRDGALARRCRRSLAEGCRVLKKLARFAGPGFMVSVAYIDPGNYATDVAAGATFRFRLLFVVLMSNLFAIFLQSLCVKLGTVTGMNLAENCRANLPRWLNYVLYVFAEAAIIATDIAEVIGTAIALNLLFHIPLVAGCAISIFDVLLILIFYRPSGSMRGLRAFELFVFLLVLGVVICFCVQLSLIKNTSAGEVFKGYLPSATLVKSEGLYQSCGILGATVMPHSLYLGSGVVQARLRDFDVRNNYADDAAGLHDTDDDGVPKYRPSLAAIRACLNFSIAELAISLFTFALFVNSAILIVAGASLYGTPGATDADLFSIHHLLSKSLAPAAGTVFALALLLSGTSAGIVCTIAGQIVSEGQLNLTIRPWVRRLMVRSISITPSIIIAGAVGKSGLSTALEATQVALSVILPFVSAPLIYFTCRNKFMTVVAERVEPRAAATDVAVGNGGGNGAERGEAVVLEGVRMRNSKLVATVAALIWGIIVVMNVALLVLVGLGKE